MDTLRRYSEDVPYGEKSLTGEYGQFVCQCCENSFGPYDDYGVTFVRKYEDGKIGEPLLGSFENGFTVDVDYVRLKLWILSMLWRADACERKFFDKINLGEQWRKKLTASVRRQSPGSDDDFAVIATLFDEDIFGSDMLQQPVRTRLKDRNFYMFYVYRGFTFFIKVDRRKRLPEWVPLTLRKDEPFPIVRCKFSQSEMKDLKKFA